MNTRKKEQGTKAGMGSLTRKHNSKKKSKRNPEKEDSKYQKESLPKKRTLTHKESNEKTVIE